MTCVVCPPYLNPIVQTAMTGVLAGAQLLVHEVWMRIIGKPHIVGRCPLHLLLLSTSKTLCERLWLLWLCYWRDDRKLPRGCLIV
jgi:hypothetical protein